MKTNARWGAAFAFLAAGLALWMVLILRTIAPSLPPTTPHTIVEYQIAFRPLLGPLLQLYALDQMFVVSYGAAFIAAALAWRKGLLTLIAVLAALATAGIDTLENLRSVAVLAGLPDGTPAAGDLDQLDFLGAVKWIGAGVTGIAIGALVPRRGVVSSLFAILFALDGVASLLLGLARLGVAAPLTAFEPTLASVVIAGMPIGLLLLGIALLVGAPRDP